MFDIVSERLRCSVCLLCAGAVAVAVGRKVGKMEMEREITDKERAELIERAKTAGEMRLNDIPRPRRAGRRKREEIKCQPDVNDFQNLIGR
jgi:hypothetical protein